MSATNPKSEMNDSLKISQNKDGSYTIDWDPQDPNWSWLNGMSSKEVQVIIKQAIEEDLKSRGS
jgi:hypothetical protein